MRIAETTRRRDETPTRHSAVDSGSFSTGGPSSPPALASHRVILPVSQCLHLGADQLSHAKPIPARGGCSPCATSRGVPALPDCSTPPTFSPFSNNFQVQHIFSSRLGHQSLYSRHLCTMYLGTQTLLNEQYLAWLVILLSKMSTSEGQTGPFLFPTKKGFLTFIVRF
jgi:hypothetical protein